MTIVLAAPFAPQSHADACNRAMLTFAKHGFRLFRREVGLFYDQRGTPRRIGIPGEADLQGWAENGAFAACEIKTGNATRSRPQKNYAAAVTRAGGFYVAAQYSADTDGDAIIENAIRLFMQRASRC